MCFPPGDFDVFPCVGPRACFVEYYYVFAFKRARVIFFQIYNSFI